ncbi:DUF1700 domain-containing protein [Hespellia stercorisuis]|uniref:Uncharacterized membrane protein n=1 Tax=Hespellia stercorisuis DSM 15480 TaxID=1121950 RepID=A0A1M6UAM2_9FIRM|nr:DUF1700 domain-containing protein [Hespellia stercorisuis]SHK66210.1 Uncharacterized membrane protein [Hespellia stercorisuis DSM 15480]
MTKTEYMESLSKRLKSLPKESYEEAMEYFEEYFAEAGEGNDQEAIENLGTVTEAANQIITDMAIENAAVPEKQKSVKKGISAVWIGILAIFAAPIALPVAFTIAILALCVVFVVGVLIFSLLISAVAVVFAGIVGVFGGIWLIFNDPACGLATLGSALLSVGIGILLCWGTVLVGRWTVRGTVKCFGRWAGRGKKHGKA